MTRRLLLLLACLVLSATASEEDIFIATEENFDALIAKNDNVLVEFFAPWCGHCKNFAPEYARAAGLLKQQNAPVILATVDGDTEKALTQRYEVRGFPNVKLFRRDKHPLQYEGARNAEELIRFIDAKTSKPTVLNSMNELTEFRAKYPSTMVLFYRSGADGQAALKRFTSECEEVTEPKCGHTDNADAVKAFVADGQDLAIVSFKNDDDVVDRYSGSAVDGPELRKFVKAYGPRLLTVADEGNLREIFLPDAASLVILTGTNALDDATRKVARDFAKERRQHLRVYTAERSHATVAEALQKFLGITDVFNPGHTLLLIVERIPGSDSAKKFVVTQHDTLEAELDQMADLWLEGKLKRHVKSEPVLPPDGKKLRTMVGATFREEINNTHAFVEFYAPWCGHCKTLAPTWERWATRAAGVFPQVLIGKMDETANEAPGVVVQGYPTLLFFPKDGEEYIKYDGKRDLDSFEEFVDDQLEEYNERQRDKQRQAAKAAKGAAKGATKTKPKGKGKDEV